MDILLEILHTECHWLETESYYHNSQPVKEKLANENSWIFIFMATQIPKKNETSLHATPSSFNSSFLQKILFKDIDDYSFTIYYCP